MATRKKYAEFQRILKEGIGTRLQSEFAKAIDIDYATLSRMLNNELLPQPRKSTLKRISENITNATLGELYMACGYTEDALLLGEKIPPKKQEHKIIMSLKDNVQLNTESLKAGIEIVLKYISAFSSFEDFIGTLRMKYSKEDVAFSASDPVETSEGRSDYYRKMMAFWKSGDGFVKNCTYFVVYYIITKNGKVIINDIRFDGEKLLSCDAIPEATINGLEEKGINVADLPYISIEERIMDNIDESLLGKAFGADLAEDMLSGEGKNILNFPSLRLGFGFWIDERFVPSGFLSFLKKHINSLPQELVAIAESTTAGGKRIGRAFDSCNASSVLGSKGIGLPIEFIIATEHPSDKKDIYWCRISDSGLVVPEFPQSCVMVDIDKKSPEQIKLIEKYMYDYASELGLTSVEMVYYPYMVSVEPGERKIVIS